MTTATETRSLVERLLDITAAVPAIKATGKSPFSKEPALSIGDVEGALRPLLVKHGVLIRFRKTDLQKVEREWVVGVTAVVSDGTDELLDDWGDCGSTPAAAYSFARKSYMKALFHIADDEDAPVTALPTAGATQTRVVASAPPAANGGRPKVLSREPVIDETTDRVRSCPDCGTGALELVTWDNKQSAICCSNWRTEDGACKHRESVPDQTLVPF